MSSKYRTKTTWWEFSFSLLDDQLKSWPGSLIKYFYFLRSSQSARVSCHIHSTQSEGVWWCSLDVQRKISCTRTPWIAGLRSPNKRAQRPSSRVLFQTCSVALVALSSWYSMTSSRPWCKKVLSSLKWINIIILIIVDNAITTNIYIIRQKN